MSKNTIIACVSNLSTAYNLVVINIVHVFIQNQYCGGDKCKSAVSVASTSCLAGAICGQLTFGYVGDCIGRSRALQLTMAMSILGALVSAFAVPFSNSHPESIFYFLALTRFFLGIGVGGVYPLSATIASESAVSEKTRGSAASIVFSMQGIGNLTVPLVAMIFVAMFKNPPNLDEGGPADTGWAWRLCLGAGAVPGILLAPFKAVETSKAHAETTQVDVIVPASSSGMAGGFANPPPALTLMGALGQKQYWGKLIGCAGGWFLFDITFYGNSLFQARVLEQIFSVNKTSGPTPIEGDLHENRALQMLVIAAIGLPGYYVAVCLMDRMGRRVMQIQGFFFMFVAFAVLGLALKPLEHAPILMLIIYGLTFFFSNFGPNSTTFILPAETFPAHLRTTLNGFCAASGKLGATIGSACFVALKSAIGLGYTMVACAIVSLVGMLITIAFVEDRRGKGMEGDVQSEPSLLDDQGTAEAAAADPNKRRDASR